MTLRLNWMLLSRRKGTDRTDPSPHEPSWRGLPRPDPVVYRAAETAGVEPGDDENSSRGLAFALTVSGVEGGEGVAAGAERVFVECVERSLDRVEEGVQVAMLGFDEQQAGHDLAGSVTLLQVGQRRNPVARVVI